MKFDPFYPLLLVASSVGVYLDIITETYLIVHMPIIIVVIGISFLATLMEITDFMKPRDTHEKR